MKQLNFKYTVICGQILSLSWTLNYLSTLTNSKWAPTKRTTRFISAKHSERESTKHNKILRGSHLTHSPVRTKKEHRKSCFDSDLNSDSDSIWFERVSEAIDHYAEILSLLIAIVVFTQARIDFLVIRQDNTSNRSGAPRVTTGFPF